MRKILATFLATLVLGGLLWGPSACWVDAESNTGLVLVVTLDDSTVGTGEATPLDTLRFYVASKEPDTGLWLMNEALEGRPVNVTGRDLIASPYRLFLADRAEGHPETVKVIVVGEREGARVLFGRLENPEEQTLERGRILERTIALRADPHELGLTWTLSGCLLDAQGIIHFGSARDRDCDGFLSEAYGGEDCDDENAAVNPSAEDFNDCDGVDNNCDGEVDPGGDLDVDQDGVAACGGDCDDGNPDIHPGALEACDGVDNNCNKQCDEGHDADGDGYTPCGTLVGVDGEPCEWVPFGDCDDQSATVHPGAEELCNGRDDNCNGVCDEGTDPDFDGFNECGSIPGEAVTVEGLCAEPVAPRIDCAPEDPLVYPGAPEVCDGLNNDCNSETAPLPTLCYAREGNVETGRCLQGMSTCGESGDAGEWGECNYDPTAAEEVPSALCAAWTLCSERPDPAACIEASVDTLPLECKVHLVPYEGFPCVEDPPLYVNPYGVSSLTGCVWTLQLHTSTAGWQAFGLVDPYQPVAPSVRLESCNAALVAKPNLMTGGQTAPPVSGTISFVYLNGQQSVFMVFPFVVGTDTDCAAGGSLTCTIDTP